MTSIVPVIRGIILFLICSFSAAEALEQTLVLQQGLAGYSGAADTYIRSEDFSSVPQNTRNYGQADKLTTRYEENRNPLLRFNLESLPDNSTIITATLSLYNATDTAGAVRNIQLHRVLRDWHGGNQNDSVVDSSGEFGATGIKAFDYHTGEGSDVLWASIGMQSGADFDANSEDITVFVILVGTTGI